MKNSGSRPLFRYDSDDDYENPYTNSSNGGTSTDDFEGGDSAGVDSSRR